MIVWMVDFIRWPYESERYPETVGVYSTLEQAFAHVPYTVEWEKSDLVDIYHADDSLGDHWIIWPATVDNPIIATYPTWEE